MEKTALAPGIAFFAVLLLLFPLTPIAQSQPSSLPSTPLPSDSVVIFPGKYVQPDSFAPDVGGMTVAEASAETGISQTELATDSKNLGSDGTSFPEGSVIPLSQNDFVSFALQSAQAANAQDPLHCVPESVSVAQAVLESGWGRSGLASKYYNFFGIKNYNNGCTSTPPLQTTEYSGGQPYSTTSLFCRYDTPADSFNSHNDFFYLNSRYAGAVTPSCRSNYKCFAEQISQSGYATDPNYANELLNLINRLGLAGVNSCA